MKFVSVGSTLPLLGGRANVRELYLGMLSALPSVNYSRIVQHVGLCSAQYKCESLNVSSFLFPCLMAWYLKTARV